MFAFDTDVLTQVLHGRESIRTHMAAMPDLEFVVPTLVAEELLRGRLAVIRQAEAGRAKIGIDRAYLLLQQTIEALGSIKLLPYTAEAEELMRKWRNHKIRGSTHDLRIAASCLVAGVTLATSNRRDFENVPGLSVEFW
jgi:tRNA(fMet)-specific endonuclease VapC